MSDGPEPWASDPNVATRQPAFCPYCGHDGAFDAVGATTGGWNDKERHYRHHCPECQYEFVTITPPPDGESE